MTVEIVFMLVLLASLTFVLATERLPVDLTALIGLISLVVFGVLSPQQAFSGFANEIIFILASIFILSAALAKSGITQLLADFILRIVPNKNNLATFLMVFVASISAFFSNTSSTGILIPVTLKIAEKAKIRASRLLMPLAFASILGGTCTLIGTSTNLASAGLISRLGMQPFALFEFIVPGLLVTVIGIVYISLIGNRFIPQREKVNFAQQYEIRDYLSQLLVETDSELIGKTLSSLKLQHNDLTPMVFIRGDKKLATHGNIKLRAGDKIIIKSSRDALLQARQNSQFTISTDSPQKNQDISGKGIDVSEFILMPQSRFVGRTLRQLDLNTRYQITVLAIYRRQSAHPVQIQNMRLNTGDVLLLQGSKQQLNDLAASHPALWVSQATIHTPLSIRKGFYVLLAMLCALILAGLSILPLSIAFLSAVVVLVIIRCTSMEDAYESIEWRLLVLIACMSSFGLAMQETGTADLLAQYIINPTQAFGLRATLAVLALLTVILTQPMSNAAAALIVLPIALSAADTMGVNARPFLVMVTLSASLSFITPLEPASLLVYGVGKYRFMDFVIVGLPLTIIVISVLVFIVPILWPFS